MDILNDKLLLAIKEWMMHRRRPGLRLFGRDVFNERRIEMTTEMTTDEALKLINTTPALQSILYDCGMLPEQTTEGSAQWFRMLGYVLAYQAGMDNAKAEIARLNALLIESNARLGHIAEILHYPKCWDTAAYPSLDSAVTEVFDCSVCANPEAHGIFPSLP